MCVVCVVVGICVRALLPRPRACSSRACVRTCVRACVCVCVCARALAQVSAHLVVVAELPAVEVVGVAVVGEEE